MIIELIDLVDKEYASTVQLLNRFDETAPDEEKHLMDHVLTIGAQKELTSYETYVMD